MSTDHKIRIRNLTILVGSTMTVLAGAAMVPALPDMSVAFRDVPNAEFLVRLALTIPALTIAAGAPIAGILLDKWGRRPVLLASLVLYGFAGTSGYVLDSLPEILISRALLGLAVAGLMSGFTTLIVDNFSGPRLNQFMGYQGAYLGLGGMVFLLAGGLLADLNWRYVFLIYSVAFLLLPAVLATIEEPTILSEPTSSINPSQTADGIFPWKTLAVIYFTAFAGMLIFYIVSVQLPYYLASRAGASAGDVGLALALQTPTAVIAALLYRRLRDRFSFQGIFAIVFLAFAINYVIVPLTTDYWIIVGSLAIGGIGLGLLPPNVNAWVAAVAGPAVRGRAIGGLTAAFFLGQFITPMVTQPLVGQWGTPATFGIFAAASLLLMLLFAAAGFVSKAKSN